MTAGRVIHVVRSDAFAGVERYIVDTATELHRRDWDVTVVGGNPARMRAELPGGVPHRSGTTVADVARSLWRLKDCDVVHAHMTAAELPAAFMKRRNCGRLVVTRHFAAHRGRSLIGVLARPLIARGVDTQIAISQFVADSLHEPSVVVYNGVPTSDQPPGLRSDTVVVVQRLEREKDTATALRAWAASGLASTGWRLAIYGRGSQEVELRALARDLAIDSSVEFGGFVDAPRSKMATAAIMLATAPAEPFGLAVVEAMAEATPVIAAGSGAHCETLGTDGVFFAAGDADGAAAQLVRLAGSAAERAALGELLRRRQVANFSMATHVDRLEEVYAS